MYPHSKFLAKILKMSKLFLMNLLKFSAEKSVYCMGKFSGKYRQCCCLEIFVTIKDSGRTLLGNTVLTVAGCGCVGALRGIL